MYAAALTTLAMIAFAANSLLARGALADASISAPAYTVVRLVSGALVLLLISQARGRSLRAVVRSGDWTAALSLFAYAAAFSYAYVLLGAATGALILFATVQFTMILWGLLRRERAGPQEVAGLAIAFGAFAWMLLPGLRAPDPLGSALMIVAGVGWGVYSLRGHGAVDPLGETTGNFLRAGLVCLPLLLLPGATAMTGSGLGLALVSGAVASALGYIVWYAALPMLSRIQAAAVQLTVPAIAAAGAVLILSETLTLRLAVSGAIVLAGVALVIHARARKAR
jgi:drug/metabolite transporter (DMT)-like permease